MRTAASFGASEKDLKHIYIQYIRIILEGSCQVWSGSLTKQNMSDLERCEKSALKIICKNYTNYKDTLKYLNLDSIQTGYKMLTLKFAHQARTHPKLKHLFPLNNKMHLMKTRKSEVFQTTHTLTERYRRSPIIYMQKLLNENTAN